MEVSENNLPEEIVNQPTVEPTKSTLPLLKQPSKTVKTLTNILTSKAFLFVVICQVISVVLQIITAAQNKSIFTRILDMLKAMGIPGIESLYNLSSLIDGTLFVFALIGMLPIILLATGYLLLYIGAIKKDNGLIIKGSFIIKIFALINAFLPAISIFILFLMAIPLIMAEIDFFLILIITIILCIPVYAVLFYYLRVSHIASGITSTIQSGKNLCKIYSYVVFCNWVVAIVGIISNLSSITSDFIGFLSSLIGSICLIIITNMMSKYKKQEGEPNKYDLPLSQR